MSETERLINIKPSEIQLEYSDVGYYSFIHYGMNTFTGVEWGSGKEDPSMFNPEIVDTDQWVRVLKDSGSKAVIFTAKHHDGFCLFQTKYTEHSIKNSPYRDGKGDIVQQLAESCKKYDMKMGIYLSPWDRHDSRYGFDEYNDYFCNQLVELCTNYGDIWMFWFDGAKGDDAPDFTYDFDRYYATIRKYQPKCIIANCGPDVRWIGNEAGKERVSEWSVVPVDPPRTESDLGSREYLADKKDLCWYPAEADVSIHHGWFYHKSNKSRTAKQLADIYFKTVGGNASLLMNVPPSKAGIIEPRDVKTLEKFKELIDKPFKTPVEKNSENLVKTVVIREDLRFSQRIEKFKIYADKKCVYSGTTIGSKKIAFLKKAVPANQIELRIIECREEAHIRDIEYFA
jgi:alpha-L-fucosidase